MKDSTDKPGAEIPLHRTGSGRGKANLATKLKPAATPTYRQVCTTLFERIPAKLSGSRPALIKEFHACKTSPTESSPTLAPSPRPSPGQSSGPSPEPSDS